MTGAQTERGAFWLCKSEPSAFSFDDLLRSPGQRTAWSGVRNHQARNFLRDGMRIGDGVLFYHSSADPTGIAGCAEVASAAVADPTQFDPRSPGYDPKARAAAPTWVQVDLRALAACPRFVTLAQMKADPALAEMLVLRRGQRLSVLPVTREEWLRVRVLAGFAVPGALLRGRAEHAPRS